MGVKKQIHIRREDKDVYEHIQAQPNHSQYIIRLVRADMQGQGRLTERDVIELIERHTQGYTQGHTQGHTQGYTRRGNAVGNSIQALLDL